MTPEGRDVLAATSERTDAFFLTRLADFSDAEKVMLEAAVLLLERLAAPGETVAREVGEAGS